MERGRSNPMNAKQRAIDLLSQTDASGDWGESRFLDGLEACHAILSFGNSEALLQRNAVFVASSRLPKKLDTIPSFFDGLLKLAVQLDAMTDVLLAAEGTTCDAMVQRIGELFRIPVIKLRTVPANKKKRNAFLHQLGSQDSNVLAVFDWDNFGLDEVAAMIADSMTVLSMGGNGNVFRATCKRLSSGKPVRMLVSEELTKQPVIDELLSLGATGWYLYGSNRHEESTLGREGKFLRPSEVDESTFLLHWTRRRNGPWPDQSNSAFLDDLIFGVERKDHRCIAALRRILATERVLATKDLTRDQRPVVCFSDVTFVELKDRRVFRKHLARWDFEPYGIGIDKAWLKDAGCRKVVYGNEADWDRLPETQRAFFQLNVGSGNVDWSVEKEWRVVGDIDLRHVPSDAAILFVPTEEEACFISEFSRWPIVVLGDE